MDSITMLEFTMESMCGDMWKSPWCLLDSPFLPYVLISSSPIMLLRLLTLLHTLLTDIAVHCPGHHQLPGHAQCGHHSQQHQTHL